MDKFLNGVVKFRKLVKPSILPLLQKLANSAQPQVLLITCVDSRLCPTSFTQADPGDMFIVRNAGNTMPHSQLFGESCSSALSERAALELAVATGVEHIAVCGHSDCKAMACLHQSSSTANTASWVSLWLKRYAQASLTKYEQLEVQGQRKGTVSVGSGSKDLETLELMFDQEKILPAVDKLSQVHVLEQMKNVKSYGFVREKLDAKALQVHGLWFDIGGGEMFMYSKMHNRFIVVNEQTLKTTFEHLTNEVIDKSLFS
ncbi:beta carbonic anhydrase 1-like [Acropora palmata]|uniref:beta carbonic anhydrase 1-like n=1 Tax=Acropora palmata TaxID=6131 RepID=UPI003DA07529